MRAPIIGDTKAEVLKEAIKLAKNNNNSQIIIHKGDGKYHKGRTYPRSIDPSKTKG